MELWREWNRAVVRIRIFERFYRTPQLRESNIPGTGLGLALVEQIVKAHGGEIAVSSRPGEGSAFSMSDSFRFEPYEVLAAADGQTGYRMAVQYKPDIVILDLMMPRMSGYEVSQKLRAEHVETPILMLTARGGEADRVRGLDLGADDYVTKSFSVLELSARVRALLRRRTRPTPTALDELLFGDVRIDFRAYQTWRADLGRRHIHYEPDRGHAFRKSARENRAD